MRTVIPGWLHRPGQHCASTAIANAMTFHGHELDEPLCFGLGAGLGFAYLEGDFLSPSRMTATRGRLLEPHFFEHVGRPFVWATIKDPQAAQAAANHNVRAGLPTLLRADIAHLPYYNSKTHFAGHVIALWGFDDDQQVALVTDTGFPGLQEVPYQDLAKARYGTMGYIVNSAEHYTVLPGPPVPDLAAAVRRAIAVQAQDLIGPPRTPTDMFGFPAMQKAARAMPAWAAIKDWTWAARWFYQVIEKRGTGGGAFRLLYAQFLEQAAALDPRLAPAAPAPEMKAIAGLWTELAYRLKEVSEQDDPSRLAQPAKLLAAIQGREQAFFQNALEHLA